MNDSERILQNAWSMERSVNVIISLMGIVLVLVGIFVFHDNQQIETIMVSVGTSIIASSIVAFLSSIYIKRYRNAKELAETWGIVSVEARRNLMNPRIDARLKETKHQYDFLAYGLKSLREDNAIEAENALKRGAKLRIITVDPNIEELKLRDQEENKIEGSTADSINKLIEWYYELKKKYPEQCELRIARFLPAWFYCREDDYVYVGPYQYGKDSQQVITTEYKRHGNGFDYYENYFEKVWNDLNYCRQLQ